MRGTKDGIDRFAISRDVEIEKPRLHLIEAFDTLLEEDLEDLLHFQVQCHQQPLRVAMA